jgi:mxaA protein
MSARWCLALRRGLCAALLALLQGAGVAADSAALLTATTVEPRAFGYQVGDVVSRSVFVHIPDGLVLDEASVPQAPARGKSLELRGIARRSHAESGGRRQELTLAYQVMLSPPQTRTLELPGFTLRFAGQPRAQELRVEAWPVTVSPLVPVDVSPRRGLGELQPDAPPPLIDTSAARYRLGAYGAVMLMLLTYLAHVYIGLPWWSRANRPFTRAWRSLRGLGPGSSEAEWREAYQRLHEALNRTAGEVLFEPGIDRFVGAQPRFKSLRDDLHAFFRQSQREFFAEGDEAVPDRAWLIEFCRRCRAVERGAA